MQEKGFIPWIFSEEKTPLFEGSNGLIQEGDKDTLLKPDSQPAHLKHSPDGWRDTLVNYGRSLTYLGLFREFTVPMKFVKDGAKILRNILWRKGKNAIAYFGLHKIDRLVYPINYPTWFYGEFDFTKAKQRQADKTFTINVMEGGLSKLLKAGESTVYDIAVDTDPDKRSCYLDGLPFTNKIIYTVYGGQEVLGFSSPEYYWLGMGVTSKTGLSQGVIMQEQIFEATSAFPNEKYFSWCVNKTISMRIRGTVSGVCSAGSGGTLNMDIRRASDSANTVYETIHIGAAGSYNDGDPFLVDFDETVAVNPHERMYIRVGASGATNKFMIYAGEITVEYDVTFEPTLTDFLSPYTLFERLVEKITAGKYGVKSTFLMALNDIGYTSGSALRRNTPSLIKTSLSDFFQDLKVRGKKQYSIGLGIEDDKIVIEELDYFFRDDIIMDLGTVNDLEVLIAEDQLFNTIKVGYKDQTVDDINGRNEVNVTQLYSTPNTRSPKELNLVSPYRADPYGIESTRSDEFGQKQTSSTADNETFVLSVEKQDTIDLQYYTGLFQLIVSAGSYYILIPAVLRQITNGLKVIITNSVSNNSMFTVENTSYLIVGFTYIKVTESVVNESVANGTITERNNLVYNLLRPAFTSITGVDHPAEIFNVLLSPKYNFYNCGGYFHNFLDKEDVNKIKFESAVRNVDLVTVLNGVTVAERSDVVIGSLAAKLFLEYYMTFSTQVPIDFMTLMASNPYGRIKFTDGKTGLVLYGFMWDGGIKPEPNDKQNWKLIAAPNQDLTRFI